VLSYRRSFLGSVKNTRWEQIEIRQIRPFLDYGSKIGPLFSLILRSESLGAGTRSFVKGVLTMVGHANGIPRIHSREEPTELAVAASISPREQEALRMLGAGLSNREIAERYSISTSTVKTHIESIFRKLGVSSRTQAIAEGKKLDLI